MRIGVELDPQKSKIVIVDHNKREHSNEYINPDGMVRVACLSCIPAVERLGLKSCDGDAIKLSPAADTLGEVLLADATASAVTDSSWAVGSVS